MKRVIALATFLMLTVFAVDAHGQNQTTVPRFRVSFDGSVDVPSLDFGGWTRWRTSAAVPPVSAAGEARIYFDGTNFRISENGSAYRVIGAGTVMSVGLTVPGVLFSVTGSPVTSSGNLGLSLLTQTANTIFAGPTSGGAATPTFRALVSNDVPVLDTSKITTGIFTTARLPANTSYLDQTIETGEITNGTILFADWNQNACASGNVPKWNGSAWACAGDDTSPGGSSWLTAGNTLAATGAKLGSLDAFDWTIVRNNVTIGTVAATGVTWNQTVTLNESGTNAIGLQSATTSIGANLGFLLLTNRTSTMPTIAGTQSGLIMDNGLIKYNQAGAGWVPLAAPTVKMLASFTPGDAEQPATNFATFGVRNNHPILMFDAATDENAFFSGVIPEYYDDSSGVEVHIHWAAASAVSGNVVWQVQFEDVNSAMNFDIDADGFAAAVSATATALGTSGFVRDTTISLTRAQADSITAGRVFRLNVIRDANNAGDTMTGDAQVIAVYVRVQ